MRGAAVAGEAWRRIGRAACAALVLLVACLPIGARADVLATEGRLNLSGWQPADGPVRLGGEWEIYRDVLIGPEAFAGAGQVVPEGFVWAGRPWVWHPFGVWTGEAHAGPTGPDGRGIATLRLRVDGLTPGQPLALALPRAGTSARLWVDGVEVLALGTVDRGAALPALEGGVAVLGTGAASHEIVWQIANPGHPMGGPWVAPRLGLASDLAAQAAAVRAVDRLIVPGLLGLALGLGLFAMAGAGRRAAAHAGIAVAAIAGTLGAGGSVWFAAWGLDWATQMTLHHIAVGVVLPFTLLAAAEALSDDARRPALGVLAVIGGMVALAAVVLPVEAAARLAYLAGLVWAPVGVVAGVWLIGRFVAGDGLAGLIALTGGGAALAIVHDGLAEFGVLASPVELARWGLVGLALALAIAGVRGPARTRRRLIARVRTAERRLTEMQTLNDTQRRHLAEVEASVAALLNDAQDGVIAIDGNGRILFANNAYRDMFELSTRITAAGQSYRSVVQRLAERGELGPGAKAQVAGAHLARVQNGDAPIGPLISAAERRLSVGRASLAEGGVMLRYRDRGAADRAVHAAAQAADRLAEARAETARAHTAWARMAAALEREARTPLNAAVGLIEMADTLDEATERRRAMARLRDTAGGVLAALETALEMARIADRGVELSEVGFRVLDVVESVVELHAPGAQAKGIKLASVVDPAIPGLLIGDPTRLRQVLSLLIGTAVRGTTEGAVLVLATAEPGVAPGLADLRVQVVDTAEPGTERHRDDDFPSLADVDLAGMGWLDPGGAGFALIREILHAMGGDVDVRRNGDAGTTVEVTVPLPIGRQDDPTLPVGLGGGRAVLVDPDPMGRSILSRYLAALGVKIYDAERLRDGSAQLRSLTVGGYVIEAAFVAAEALAPDLDKRLRRMEPEGGIPTVRVVLDDRYVPILPAEDVPEDVALLHRPIRRDDLYRLMAEILGRTEALADQGAGPTRAEATEAGRLFLLVNDEAEAADRLARMLGTQGYAADCAADDDAALAAFDADVHVGVVIESLRGTGNTPRLVEALVEVQAARAESRPIFVVSGDADGDADILLPAGAQAVLPKPVDAHTVIAALLDVTGTSVPDEIADLNEAGADDAAVPDAARDREEVPDFAPDPGTAEPDGADLDGHVIPGLPAGEGAEIAPEADVFEAGGPDLGDIPEVPEEAFSAPPPPSALAFAEVLGEIDDDPLPGDEDRVGEPSETSPPAELIDSPAEIQAVFAEGGPDLPEAADLDDVFDVEAAVPESRPDTGVDDEAADDMFDEILPDDDLLEDDLFETVEEAPTETSADGAWPDPAVDDADEGPGFLSEPAPAVEPEAETEEPAGDAVPDLSARGPETEGADSMSFAREGDDVLSDAAIDAVLEAVAEVEAADRPVLEPEPPAQPSLEEASIEDLLGEVTSAPDLDLANASIEELLGETEPSASDAPPLPAEPGPVPDPAPDPLPLPAPPAPVAPVRSAPPLPAFDPEALTQAFGSDTGGAQALMDEFMTAFEARVADIETAIMAKSAKTAANAARQVRGAAKALGLAQVAAHAVTLELAATAGDWDGVAAELADLKAARDGAQAAMRETVG